MRPNKTFIPKVSDLKRSWYIIDAEGLVLGRLAAIVANKLRGKDKVFFTPNMQCGDNIIIVNSEKVLLKGQKRFNKNYLHIFYKFIFLYLSTTFSQELPFIFYK